MVDGVDVGISECFHHGSHSLDEKDERPSFLEHYQKFQGADLIVINRSGSYERQEATEDKTKGCRFNIYPMYAVFGNKVISAEVSEQKLTSYYDLWKDKLILAKQKPYILSGVLYEKLI